MNIVDFENLETLPVEFIERLKACDRQFKSNGYIEHLFDDPAISGVVQDLNDYCLKNLVTGIHYTRAIPEDIHVSGLLMRDGNEIRTEFINRFGDRFTSDELLLMKAAWAKYFDSSMNSVRDSRIFFNFTTKALNTSSSSLLVGYFGGEQVYFPIYDFPGIKEKLAGIGTPLMLKCALNPNAINTYIVNPWGQIAVSAYHRTINKSAHIVDQDGYQCCPVPAKNIKVIHL